MAALKFMLNGFGVEFPSVSPQEAAWLIVQLAPIVAGRQQSRVSAFVPIHPPKKRKTTPARDAVKSRCSTRRQRQAQKPARVPSGPLAMFMKRKDTP